MGANTVPNDDHRNCPFGQSEHEQAIALLIEQRRSQPSHEDKFRVLYLDGRFEPLGSACPGTCKGYHYRYHAERELFYIITKSPERLVVRGYNGGHSDLRALTRSGGAFSGSTESSDGFSGFNLLQSRPSLVPEHQRHERMDALIKALQSHDVLGGYDMGFLLDLGHSGLTSWQGIQHTKLNSLLDDLELKNSIEVLGDQMPNIIRHEAGARYLQLQHSYNSGPLSHSRPDLRYGLNPDYPSRGSDGWKFGLTPLARAAMSGHKTVVKILIQRGADVNVDTGRKSALHLAAQYGHESIVRLLLSHGADLRSTVFEVRNSGQAGADHTNRLLNVATKFLEEHKNNDTFTSQTKLREIKKNFSYEHDKVWSYLRRPGLERARSPQSEASKSWSKAVRGVRRLCNRIPPDELSDALLILALARSVAKHLDDQLGPRHTEHRLRFDNDLARWQILFDKDDRRLRAYRDAVKTIWHVDLQSSELEAVPAPEEDVGRHYQDLAFTFVTVFEGIFQDGTSSGIPPGRQSELPGNGNPQTRHMSSPTRFASISYGAGQPDVTNTCGLIPLRMKRKRQTASTQLLNQLNDCRSDIMENIDVNWLHLFLMMGTVFAFIIHFLLIIKNDKYQSAMPDFPVAAGLSASISLLLAFFDLPEHYCDHCGIVFATKSNLTRHGREDSDLGGEQRDRTGKRRRSS